MPEAGELSGWKAIADYLGVGLRTAQDYERTRGLPVNRLPGPKGRVFAYPQELDAWRLRSQYEKKHSTDVTDAAVRLALPLAGHWGYGLLMALIHGLLYAEAAILEIAYQFDALGHKTGLASVAVLLWAALTTLSALYIDWRHTARAKGSGLLLSISVLYGGALLLQLALRYVLPPVGITEEVGRQPQSAQAAYFKDVILYFLPLATIYILLPFHFVLALQREQTMPDGYSAILALLAGEQRSVPPTGAFYLHVSWLSWGLLGTGVLSLILTQNLFDHLRATRYMNLFMVLALGRCLLYFGLGLSALLWYARQLNDIKRKCIKQRDFEPAGGLQHH